jgi:hypothetical protein
VIGLVKDGIGSFLRLRLTGLSHQGHQIRYIRASSALESRGQKTLPLGTAKRPRPSPGRFVHFHSQKQSPGAGPGQSTGSQG